MYFLKANILGYNYVFLFRKISYYYDITAGWREIIKKISTKFLSFSMFVFTFLFFFPDNITCKFTALLICIFCIIFLCTYDIFHSYFSGFWLSRNEKRNGGANGETVQNGALQIEDSRTDRFYVFANKDCPYCLMKTKLKKKKGPKLKYAL